MQQDASDTPAEQPDSRALAEQTLELLMRGYTLLYCAEEIKAFGGSILRVHECLDAHFSNQQLRAIAVRTEHARAIRLERIKQEVLQELREMAAQHLADTIVTIEEARAIDVRRRAAISLLRLKAFPTARDSYNDTISSSRSSGRRSSSSGTTQGDPRSVHPEPTADELRAAHLSRQLQEHLPDLRERSEPPAPSAASAEAATSHDAVVAHADSHEPKRASQDRPSKSPSRNVGVSNRNRRCTLPVIQPADTADLLELARKAFNPQAFADLPP